ncbi:hypothetical protein RPHASCH2410_CH07690 [Rhizobium phaseoli Ch24-10]|nr:hypothetical protein RPHASCH2410_CH07690 [Rhizobium phaseoli Ch24-10]
MALASFPNEFSLCRQRMTRRSAPFFEGSGADWNHGAITAVLSGAALRSGNNQNKSNCHGASLLLSARRRRRSRRRHLHMVRRAQHQASQPTGPFDRQYRDRPLSCRPPNAGRSADGVARARISLTLLIERGRRGAFLLSLFMGLPETRR